MQRYQRQLRLPNFGLGGQQKLLATKVLVVGAGGLGCPVLVSLVSAGLGTVGVLDFDTVQSNNLARQTLFTQADVGALKAVAAEKKLRTLNPDVEIRSHAVHLEAGNAVEICQNYDLIVDGVDDFSTHYILAQTAEELRIPLIWGSALGNDGLVSVFSPHLGTGRFTDLFPDATAASPETCETQGMLGATCQTVAGLLAGQVIALVTGNAAPLLGRILSFDAATFSFREITFTGQAPPPPKSKSEPVDSLSAAELSFALGSPKPPVLVDARSRVEFEAFHLPGAVWFDEAALWRGEFDLPSGHDVVVYCTHDARARFVAGLFRDLGVSATFLRGGILGFYPPANGGRTSSFDSAPKG